MSCCASRTRRTVFGTLVSLVLVTGGSPAAWSVEPDAYEAPFEGPVHLDDSSLPDPTRTPGDALEHAKRKDLCDEDIDTSRRAPASALCDNVFTDYRIPPEGRFQYKCSYLVPLSIGGAATQINVWPQPVAEAPFKEKLDIELHNQVCSDDISPVQAQREIVSDWVKTYRRYILLSDPPPQIIESRATEDPLSVPAGPTLSPAGQGMPAQILPDGMPTQGRRRDPRAASDGGGTAVPQSVNSSRPQRSDAAVPRRPAAATLERRATLAQRRGVIFPPRGGTVSRLRNIGRP